MRSQQSSMMNLKTNESPVRTNYQQYGVEDTLDRFQKEQLNKQYSNAYNNPSQNVYSPTFCPNYQQSKSLSNSPLKKGSQETFFADVKPQSGQTFPVDPRIDASPTEKNRDGKHINFHSLLNLDADYQLSEQYQHNNHTREPNNVQQVRKNNYEDLSYETASRQRGYDRKVEEPFTRQGYNILNNQSASHNSFQEKLPYGRNISALLTDHEEIVKSNSPKRQGNSFSQTGFDRSGSMRNPADAEVAGRHNYYGETEFRYANKLPEQEPLQKDQIYGGKALKNLSCLKLY
jgi:hypothetical protein